MSRAPISLEFVRFEYTDNRKTLHSVSVDMTRTLDVVGDPNNGSYEWLIRNGEKTVEAHSNCGYGSPDIALRDGLIYYHGVPTEQPIYVSRGLEPFNQGEHT